VRPAPTWTVTPAISSEHLTRLRREFWETRVEGNHDMWNALRAAAEADSVRHSNAIMIIPFVVFAFAH
jgi:hypothetical protein